MSTLKDLYALAYAPLRSTILETYENVQKEDLDEAGLLKELHYLREFADEGLSLCEGHIRANSNDNKTEEAAASLYCLTDFLRKLHQMVLTASNMAAAILLKGYPDSSNLLRQMGICAKEGILVPDSEPLRNLLDISSELSWCMPYNTPPQQSRVVFRNYASSVIETLQEDQVESVNKTKSALKPTNPQVQTRNPPTDSANQGNEKKKKENKGLMFAVESEPLKGERERNKIHKSTGFAKFHFKDDENSDNDQIEANSETSVVHHADEVTNGGIRFDVSDEPLKVTYERKNVRKATGYAKFNFKDIEDNDESDSDGGPISTSPTRSSSVSTAVPCTPPVVPPSGSTNNDLPRCSSELAERDKKSPSSQGFLCFGTCGHTDKDEIVCEGSNRNYPLRRGSSVGIGNVVDIEDEDADMNWHDHQRHDDRFKRIRNRRPTGHPSALKLSEELIKQLKVEGDDEESV